LKVVTKNLLLVEVTNYFSGNAVRFAQFLPCELKSKTEESFAKW